MTMNGLKGPPVMSSRPVREQRVRGDGDANPPARRDAGSVPCAGDQGATNRRSPSEACDSTQR
jgi:hypothetical protein